MASGGARGTLPPVCDAAERAAAEAAGAWQGWLDRELEAPGFPRRRFRVVSLAASWAAATPFSGVLAFNLPPAEIRCQWELVSIAFRISPAAGAAAALPSWGPVTLSSGAWSDTIDVGGYAPEPVGNLLPVTWDGNLTVAFTPTFASAVGRVVGRIRRVRRLELDEDPPGTSRRRAEP